MSTREKEIDVQRSTYNVIDREFDNMRDRFDAEMRRVEEEMGRLRREFEGYTPKMNQNQLHHQSPPPPPITRSPVSSTITNGHQQQHHRDYQYQQYQQSATSPRYSPSSTSPVGHQQQYQSPTAAAPPPPPPGEIKRYDPYLDNLKSPLIREERDGKTLRLRFDVSQYLPEEITVKTVDNRLFVHAKHEEKSPQRTVYREYNQEFMLPRGTNPEYITSTLSADGVLTVEAPLPSIEGPGGGYHLRHPIMQK